MKIYNIILFFSIFTSCGEKIETDSTIKFISHFDRQYFDLMKALYSEDDKKIKDIVNKNKFDLNVCDSKKAFSFLTWCIENDKEKSFLTLLKLGADPNWQDSLGLVTPAIIFASQIDFTTKYITHCLNYGGKINLINKDLDDLTSISPLYGAIYSNNIENVKLLVKNGAKINYEIDSVASPLSQALIEKKMDISLFLLENGADYNNLKLYTYSQLKDKKGDYILNTNGSPIFYAVSEVSVLKLLTDNNFPVDSEDYRIKKKIISFLQKRGFYWVGF